MTASTAASIARQAEVAALGEGGVGQAGMEAAEPGGVGERCAGHRVGGADRGEVGAERVGLGGRGGAWAAQAASHR